jgi:hypothetical protein
MYRKFYGLARKPFEKSPDPYCYLLARSRRGETTALIVDEAQLLSWELLEEIPETGVQTE